MRFSSLEIKRPPKLQRIRSVEDLDNIEFVDGIAEVEVPVEMLGHLPLKHDERNDSPRLDAVERSIRAKGYSSVSPIVCRIGPLGRWVVIDGGHRLTAVEKVANDFWTKFWRRDLGDVTFILYETELSYSKLPGGRRPTLTSTRTRPAAPANHGPAAGAESAVIAPEPDT